MRNFLYLKFALIYLTFGYIIILISSTFTSTKFDDLLQQEAIDQLYNSTFTLSTNSISRDYFINLINGEPDENAKVLQSYISNEQKQSNASFWLTDIDGRIVLSTIPTYENKAPYEINEFSPNQWGKQKFLLGNYNNYLQNQSISIIQPILDDYHVIGYLIVHQNIDEFMYAKTKIMNTVDITLLLIYLFSFLILLGVHIFIYIPLQKITFVATQYSMGDLNHQISINTADELGYLSSSLNKMSCHLKSVSEYQKQFVGNVSHDFRSPLTSINGYINAIADGTIPPELHQKYFDIILYETQRLTNLTKDLLLLNELGSTEVCLSKEKFDLCQMIRNVSLSFEGACNKKDLSINLELSNNSIFVFADYGKIQQVLYNLIDNAIKFTPNNSSITIDTSDNSDKIMVHIKDSGCGISPQHIGKVFERFYKLDSSRGKDKKGTGLGLAIVKEIIQSHDESITVDSIPDVETCFTFSLPKSN